ncbi:MAG: nucleotide sugar dehydrogenase [Cellulosilyticum sp.]|nr:nucleotide sugar dehydrogenase [Cellulosilyticum sp.]
MVLLDSYEQLINKKRKLAVVGLGYVGLPLAIAFSEEFSVIGLDNNERKVKKYLEGKDPTGEVGSEAVKNSSVIFTCDFTCLKEASFIIVAVPTPIHSDHTPDLTAVIQASKLVGENLSKNTVVVFESTVYPGVTEEICVSEIEKVSGLVCGKDFVIGYSPERINPGDKVHTLRTIKKIVSGMNQETLDIIAKVYESIIDAGVYRAENIRIAEAAKLLENSQRDVNIAFMNEVALVCHRMGIDTSGVIRAMNTKWNALEFQPGLVGGHCIGVDPYYFIYQAEKLGYHSSIIAAGRRINNDMPVEIAHKIIRQIILSGKKACDMKIYMLGMTFKGNCPDLRNTKAGELKKALESYGLHLEIVDPQADEEELRELFKQQPVRIEDIKDADCLIFTADHREFKALEPGQLADMMSPQGCRLIVDVRNIYRREDIEEQNCKYWSL